MYKPKVRVNVAEGAYVVILDWQAEASAVKGAGVGYVSNNGKAWIQVTGFKVSSCQSFMFQSLTQCEIAWQREWIKESA